MPESSFTCERPHDRAPNESKEATLVRSVRSCMILEINRSYLSCTRDAPPNGKPTTIPAQNRQGIKTHGGRHKLFQIQIPTIHRLGFGREFPHGQGTPRSEGAIAKSIPFFVDFKLVDRGDMRATAPEKNTKLSLIHI